MKTAAYGSWKSPITSDLIVAQSISLAEVRLDGPHIYWLEGRPQEQGRFVVVRRGDDGKTIDLTPHPFNVRTRVHEYGGGAWMVADGILYYSNFADSRLYRLRHAGADAEPLTPASPSRERDWRFADGVIDRRRRRCPTASWRSILPTGRIAFSRPRPTFSTRRSCASPIISRG